MDIRLTSIINAKDVKPSSFLLEWNDLMALFAEHAAQVRLISDKDQFKIPALYPTVYADDAFRKSKDNVIGYGSWTAVDIDHVMTFDALKAFFLEHHLDGCLYTTTSHSMEDPRVRGVFLLNREIELSEFDEFWYALNEFFGKTLDPQTKNINRIYYVPAKWNDDALFERVIGKELDVDALLCKFPYPYKDIVISSEIVKSKIDHIRSNLKPTGSSWSADNAITEAMTSRFLSSREGGRLFKLEVAIAKRALWMRYPITASEVESIALSYDKITTGKRRQNTLQEAQHALSIAEQSYASLYIEGDQHTDNVSDRTEQNWIAPLNDYTINVLNAPCGAGKTYQMLRNISVKGGKWLYVCDMIKNIKEREDEFRTLALKHNRHGFQICKAYYDDATPVAKQVSDIIDGIYRKDVIIFITHAALQILDARVFEGFNLVIDEAYEVISQFERRWNCNIDLADRYFTVSDTDSDYYQIVATDAGNELVDKGAFDDINDTFQDLLKTLSGRYTTLWVWKKDWEKRSENRISFWVVSSPEFLQHFGDVWLLGDEIEHSPIYLVWHLQHHITFNFMPLTKQRKRKMELAERGTIYYFAEHRQASTNQFRKGDSPLLAITGWLTDNFKNDAFYYAFNDAKGHAISNIDQECKYAEKISLKATGINTLQHHTMCVWLGSMKLSGQERTIMERIFSIDYATQVRWREYNPLYQFVMRSALRDYESDANVSVYVFDRYQAEYLHERTGMPIIHIPGVIVHDAVSTGGRPAQGDRPMTGTERSRASRERKKALALAADATEPL